MDPPVLLFFSVRAIFLDSRCSLLEVRLHIGTVFVSPSPFYSSSYGSVVLKTALILERVCCTNVDDVLVEDRLYVEVWKVERGSPLEEIQFYLIIIPIAYFKLWISI